MNLKDYSKTKLHNTENASSLKGFNPEKVQEQYGDLVEEFLKRYGKMSEDQLLEEMFLLVKQKKKDGTFNKTQLENATKALAPFLDASQKKKMFELLKKL